ncbi:MAG: hypothetical protein R3F49_21095 [Planctomycetota bacterium]
MVRILIVLLVLGCGFLGWTAYNQQQRLTYLRGALAADGLVPKTVASIQQSAELYSTYKDRGASDKLQGEDPRVYISARAGHPRVMIGRVDITPGREADVTRGVVDRPYRIEPNDRKASFNRANIANFLYKLEEDSQRVKVTYIDMKPATKTPEGERPVDLWQLTAGISTREKKATGPGVR